MQDLSPRWNTKGTAMHAPKLSKARRMPIAMERWCMDRSQRCRPERPGRRRPERSRVSTHAGCAPRMRASNKPGNALAGHDTEWPARRVREMDIYPPGVVELNHCQIGVVLSTPCQSRGQPYTPGRRLPSGPACRIRPSWSAGEMAAGNQARFTAQAA